MAGRWHGFEEERKSDVQLFANILEMIVYFRVMHRINIRVEKNIYFFVILVRSNEIDANYALYFFLSFLFLFLFF